MKLLILASAVLGLAPCYNGTCENIPIPQASYAPGSKFEDRSVCTLNQACDIGNALFNGTWNQAAATSSVRKQLFRHMCQCTSYTYHAIDANTTSVTQQCVVDRIMGGNHLFGKKAKSWKGTMELTAPGIYFQKFNNHRIVASADWFLSVGNVKVLNAWVDVNGNYDVVLIAAPLKLYALNFIERKHQRIQILSKSLTISPEQYAIVNRFAIASGFNPQDSEMMMVEQGFCK